PPWGRPGPLAHRQRGLVGSLPGISIGSHVAARISDRFLLPVLASILVLIGLRLIDFVNEHRLHRDDSWRRGASYRAIPSCSLFKGRISMSGWLLSKATNSGDRLGRPGEIGDQDVVLRANLDTGTKSASSRNGILGRKAGAALTGTLNA